MYDFNIENKFWHGLDRNRFAKYFNQLKILEMSNLEDDGLCLELGVFKATSLIRLAHHLKYLQPNKLIYGFDVFGEFPQSNDPSSQDLLFLEDWKETAGEGLKKQQVEDILKDIDVDNVRLIEGDIRVTLKDFLEKMKRPISFVHLDVDLFEVTRDSMNICFPYLRKGTVIMFDDYNKVEGATKAIDEIANKYDWIIQKQDAGNQPYFTIIKN